MPDLVARREPTIHFLGEQDGQPERQLKSALSALFASGDAVQRAYLARVRYGDEQAANVALALVAAPASPELVDAVQKVFHSMFGIGQHLDIFFASPRQEAEISLTCRAFFGDDAPANVI